MARRTSNMVTKPTANKAAPVTTNKPIEVTDGTIMDTGDDYVKIDTGRLEISMPLTDKPLPPSDTRKGHLYYTTHGVKDFKGEDGLANGFYLAVNLCYDPKRIGREVD